LLWVSGQAMAMGQKGEADVLLVHSPDAEKKFVEDGYGITVSWLCTMISLLSAPAMIRPKNQRCKIFRRKRLNWLL